MKRRTRKTSDSPVITVNISSTAWTKALRTAAARARRAAAATLEAVFGIKDKAARSTEISILLTTDHTVRRLNADYRGQDKPTNVLSFPAFSPRDLPTGLPGAPLLLGDVVIAFGVTNREAKNEGKSLAAHLSHLVVHGVLHLLGYDHERDRDAEKMEKLETDILARLGVADPYAEISPDPRRAARKKARLKS